VFKRTSFSVMRVPVIIRRIQKFVAAYPLMDGAPVACVAIAEPFPQRKSDPALASSHPRRRPSWLGIGAHCDAEPLSFSFDPRRSDPELSNDLARPCAESFTVSAAGPASIIERTAASNSSTNFTRAFFERLIDPRQWRPRAQSVPLHRLITAKRARKRRSAA
jgi:hypothetical protein